MATFFRIQGKGISLEEMQAHKSADGGSEGEHHEGLCACETVSELRDYIRSFAHPVLSVRDLDEDCEVVIVRGRRIGRVYDGVLIYPEKIVERVSVSEFFADDRFLDYEDCW
jgi:hypothetical protein